MIVPMLIGVIAGQAIIAWSLVLIRVALERQANAMELMLAAPTMHARDHDEDLRRRAREIMRGREILRGDERGEPPIILDDEHEAALEERAMKARDDG